MLRLAAGVRDVIFPVRGDVRRVSRRYLTLLVLLPLATSITWAVAAELFGIEYRETGASPAMAAVLAGALIINTMLMLRIRMDVDKARKKATAQYSLRIPLLLDETAVMSLWGASVGLLLTFATATTAAIYTGVAVATPVAAVLVFVAVHFAGCLSHTLAATLSSYRALVTPIR